MSDERKTGEVQLTDFFRPKDSKDSKNPTCGENEQADEKAGVTIKETPSTETPSKKSSKQHKTGLIIGVCACAIAAVAAIAVFAVPLIAATPETLIEQGKYEAAYKKAPEDNKPEVLSMIIGKGEFQTAYDLAPEEQKRGIILANLAAYVSKEELNDWKNPDSFLLREIYFGEGSFSAEGTKTLVLRTSGENSLGGNVFSWQEFQFNEESQEYRSVLMTVPDLDEESLDGLINFEEKFNRAVRNTVRQDIQKIISEEGSKVDDVLVNGVNLLFKERGFNGVELMDPVTSLYPNNVDTKTI